jgi:hypothetical protein
LLVQSTFIVKSGIQGRIVARAMAQRAQCSQIANNWRKYEHNAVITTARN